MKKIKGNLITLALQGEFDVIAHGVNCFNTQKNGIAKDMVTHFKTDTFPLEMCRKGDYNKLGNIDWMQYTLYVNDFNLEEKWAERQDSVLFKTPDLTVVNCYTQFYHKRNAPNYKEGDELAIIDAITMCLNKLVTMFPNKRIGIPYIGCGLAGLSKSTLETLIALYIEHHNLTLVEYDNT